MTCGRDSVRCAAGRSQHVDTPACCLHHLHTVLRETVRILESHGIPYWADGGTLLGAVRDQAVIPWDTDADLGVMAADVPRVLGLAHAWEALGFEVQRHCGGALLRITYSPVNDMGVDLYPWAEDGDYLLPPLQGPCAPEMAAPLFPGPVGPVGARGARGCPPLADGPLRARLH